MIYKPKHPGCMVKTLCLDPLDLSIADAAKILNVSCKLLTNIVRGKIDISNDIALKLASIFNTSEKMWSNLQASYNAWRKMN